MKLFKPLKYFEELFYEEHLDDAELDLTELTEEYKEFILEGEIYYVHLDDYDTHFDNDEQALFQLAFEIMIDRAIDEIKK